MKATRMLLVIVLLLATVPGCCMYRCASQGEWPGSGCSARCTWNHLTPPERWCWGNCQVDESGRATVLQPEVDAYGQPLAGQVN